MSQSLACPQFGGVGQTYTCELKLSRFYYNENVTLTVNNGDGTSKVLDILGKRFMC